MQQFRIAGLAELVDSSVSNPELVSLRNRAWQKLSPSTKQQYVLPEPGAPRADAEIEHGMAQGTPVTAPDTFALVLCHPDEVDHVTLGEPLQRVGYLRNKESSQWQEGQDLNP
jgi:hypothetical protein